MSEDQADAQWYSVRCVFRWESDEEPLYEERMTLWRADDLDEAIALAESESATYAEANNVEYLGLAQGYWLVDPPSQGAEIYSMLRASELDPDDYLDRFFDTGHEREQPDGRG